MYGKRIISALVRIRFMNELDEITISSKSTHFVANRLMIFISWHFETYLQVEIFSVGLLKLKDSFDNFELFDFGF